VPPDIPARLLALLASTTLLRWREERRRSITRRVKVYMD